MKKIYLSIVGIVGLAVLTFIPLSDRAVRSVLNEAENRMVQEPGRALALLDSIAAGQPAWRESVRARFALLYTQARDKNYIDVDDDSLIVRAVGYYRNHGDHRSRAMAYYYHGVILHNAGHIDGAMEALVKAQLEAESCDDSYLQGLVYSELGNAYYSQYTYSESSEMYKIAVSRFENSKSQNNIFIAKYCCGLSLFLNNNFQEAIEYLSSALQYAEKENNIDAILNIEIALIHMKIKNGICHNDLTILKQNLLQKYTQYTKDVIPLTHYPIISSLYIEEQNLDSARYYITKFLDNTPNIEYQNIGSFALLSLIESKCKNYQMAYNYEKQYSQYSDSLNAFFRKAEVRALDRKYKNKELKISYKKLQTRHRHERIGALLLLSLMCIAGWGIYRYNLRKREEEREAFDISLDEFRRHCSELEEQYNRLAKRRKANDARFQSLSTLFDKRMTDLKQITEWASLYEKKPDTFYQKVKEYFELSEKANKELIGDVLSTANLYCFGIVDYLRKICPALSSRELCYCGLISLGFTPECIRILFNHKNPYSIYTIRNKVRDKLKLKKSASNLEKHIQDLQEQAKIWTESSVNS